MDATTSSTAGVSAGPRESVGAGPDRPDVPVVSPLRRSLGYAVAVVVLVCAGHWLYTHGDEVGRSADLAGDAGRGWIVVAAVAALFSLVCAGYVQRVLLSAAGVRTSIVRNVGLVLASNAWSVTLPAGGLFGTALTFRYTRRWGATPGVALWQIVVAGVFATAALVALGVVGGAVGGAPSVPGGVAGLALGATAIALGAVAVWRRRAAILDGVEAAVRALERRRGRGDHPLGRRVRSFADQVAGVRIGRGTAVSAFGWSVANWVSDFGVLVAAAWAVGAHPAPVVLAAAYLVSKLVTSLQLTPGGVGAVETGLVGALAVGGVPAEHAIAAVAIYRVVSWVLVAGVGWAVYVRWFRAHTASGPSPAQG